MDWTVKNDAYVGEASKKMDGMAMAEPMRVCGRVNLQSTFRKDGFGCFVVVVKELLLVDAVLMDDSSPLASPII